jgi:hypothetical protein
VLYYQLRTTEAECNTSSGSVVRVQINLETRFQVAACAANQTSGWEKVSINLSAFAGETITVVLRADLGADGAYAMFDDVGLEVRQ